jgi:hypothetical protein
MTEEQANALKRRYSPRLLRLPGVSGVGVERADGGYTVTVYLSAADDATLRRLPADLEGHPYRRVVTGPFSKQ